MKLPPTDPELLHGEMPDTCTVLDVDNDPPELAPVQEIFDATALVICQQLKTLELLFRQVEDTRMRLKQQGADVRRYVELAEQAKAMLPDLREQFEVLVTQMEMLGIEKKAGGFSVSAGDIRDGLAEFDRELKSLEPQPLNFHAF